MSLAFVRPLSKLMFLAVLVLVVATGPGCKKKTPEDKFVEAQQLLQEKQVSLAVLKMKDLIKESPDSEVIPEVRMMLAQVYLNFGGEGNFKKAIEQLEILGSDLGVTTEIGYGARATIPNLYMKQGDLETALIEAERNVELAAGNPEIEKDMIITLGRYQLLSEDEAVANKAIEVYNKFMLEDEDPSVRGQSRELLAKYYRDQQEYGKSNAVYDQYMEAYPEDTIKPMLQMAKALNLKKMEEDEKAKQVFDTGYEGMMAQIEEELDGQTRNMKLSQLASLTIEFGDYDRAISLYKQIMSENPMTKEAIQAQGAIGDVYLRAEQYDQAIAHYEQMAGENPNSQIAQNAQMKIGEVYIRQEKFDEGIAYFEKLAADNPESQLGAAAANYANGIRQLKEQVAQAAQEAEEAVSGLGETAEEATKAVEESADEAAEAVEEITEQVDSE